MTSLAPIAGLAVLLAAALATISIWAPRRLPAKLAALAVAALFLPLGYAAFSELLGRPKPAEIAWWERQAEEATVLAGQMHEGEAIYLWLQLPGAPEPLAYRLPWDGGRAQQLQDALRTAQAQGSGVKVRRPFGRRTKPEEQEAPMFYAEPQAALPEKAPPTAAQVVGSAG